MIPHTPLLVSITAAALLLCSALLCKLWNAGVPILHASHHHEACFCSKLDRSQRLTTTMAWAMQQHRVCGHALVAVTATWTSRVHQQSVVKLDKKRVEALKLKRSKTPIIASRTMMGHVGGVVASSQALQDKAVLLFARICVNPKVLSVDAADFMLAVAASHAILPVVDADAASQADVVLRGVHPSSFQPVLLVCTTTMFATPVAPSDVEKAQRRGALWQTAVGPAFVVVPVVVGYALSPEVAAFSTDMGVLSYDLS